MDTSNILSLTVKSLPDSYGESLDSCRLDSWLTKQVNQESLSRTGEDKNGVEGERRAVQVSRSAIRERILLGAVCINGITTSKPATKVQVGDTVTIDFAIGLKVTPLAPYDFPLNILHEDDTVLVIDKPPGIAVHPGSGTGPYTLVNAIIAHGRKNGWDPTVNFTVNFDASDKFNTLEQPVESLDITTLGSSNSYSYRPGIVHRLDKDTSGIIVVAKTRSAHNNLSSQFHDRTIQRKYLALALVMPRRFTPFSSDDNGKIELPIGRDPHQRTLMKINGIGSRRAVTHFEVEKRLPFCALLSLRLETGRTHQIRVHCAAVGSPLIGDPVYGEDHLLPTVLQRAAKELGRQALHATQLGFRHPSTDKFLLFNSPFPEDFNRIYSVFNHETTRKNNEHC